MPRMPGPGYVYNAVLVPKLLQGCAFLLFNKTAFQDSIDLRATGHTTRAVCTDVDVSGKV